MQIGEHQVVITRKPIKHLYLRIKNADQVHVSAPKHWPLGAIEKVITERSEWIKQQQLKLTHRPPPQVPRLENGSLVPFCGAPYTVRVEHHSGRGSVRIMGDEIIFQTAHVDQQQSLERMLDSWYRRQLKQKIRDLLQQWQPCMGVTASDFGVRKMKTRWGSCNINSKKIWLNLELIKKSSESLEYVVVHELTHLYERYHNARFYALMDRFLPDWSERRHRLNYLE